MTASSPPTADFAKGLAGVVAGQTTICSLSGTLRYRGYDIEPLARTGDFEEVAFLLLHGELPTAPQLAAFRDRVATAASTLPTAVLDALAGLARSAPQAAPMDALRTGVSMLGLVARDDLPGPRPELLAQAERLLGQVPAILTAWIDMTTGRPVAPWPAKPLAAALLERLTGRVPTSGQVAIFGTTLVLYAEHEFNASTFAARTVASTGSDMHSAITAAIGALKGPLHGGAPSRVLTMLDEVEASGDADAWVKKALDRGDRLMGFGHRVYRAEDPRARVLRRTSKELGSERFEVAEALEEAALAELKARKPDRVLATNVEFWSAVVLDYAEIPPEMFTSMFTCARVAGWSAHIMEQKRESKLIRPSAKYVGPGPRGRDEV